MRALWVADKLGYADRMHGVGAYFKYVLPAMPPGSVIPVVLRCSDQLDRQLASAGVSLRRLQHMKMDPRTLVSLLRIIRREQIDLLHLHGYGASTFGRLAARLTGRPAIIHQHDSITARVTEGRRRRSLVSEVSRETHHADARIGCGQLRQERRRLVRAPVVCKDDLERMRYRRERSVELT